MTGVSSTNSGMVLQQAQTTSQAVGATCSGVQGGDFDIPVPLVVTLPSTMQIVLDSEEIGHLVDAVHSLHVDRILPDEKTLKARLKLRIKPNRVCILSHVLELYSEIKSMRVVMDHENGGPAIFLKDEPNGFLGFVDPCSNADPYPDTVWQHFENHLRTMLDDMNSRQQSDGSLTEKTTGPGSAGAVTFHRGRYGMAKDLYDRKLPFFEGLVLGQVCHIVELAIQRDLLHYENNLLLPAQACGKYHNAIYGVPTASAANQRHTPSANYVQSMEELKHLMADLLTRYPDGFNLSTLKTKIKSYYNKRLSETVFYETKLLTLVQNPPLDAIAKIVKLQGNCGYLCQPAFDVGQGPRGGPRPAVAPPRNGIGNPNYSGKHNYRPQGARMISGCDHYGHHGSGGSTMNMSSGRIGGGGHCGGPGHYGSYDYQRGANTSGGSGSANWRAQQQGGGSYCASASGSYNSAPSSRGGRSYSTTSSFAFSSESTQIPSRSVSSATSSNSSTTYSHHPAQLANHWHGKAGAKGKGNGKGYNGSGAGGGYQYHTHDVYGRFNGHGTSGALAGK